MELEQRVPLKGTNFALKIPADGGEISLEKLNAAMQGKPISFRMRLKGCLAAARLID